MSGTYRHGRVYCQMADCRNRATRLVKVELPATWSGASEYTARTLLVGVCGDCGRDLESRARALLGARAEFGHLLTIIDEAVGREFELSGLLRRAVELIRARVQLRKAETYAELLGEIEQPAAWPAGLTLARIERELGRPDALSDRDPGDPAA